jgi:uncharacterized membrane protein
MLYVRLALLSLFMVWLRRAQLVLAMTFPSTIGPDAPLLLDRPVGMAEAVARSWTPAATNGPAMAVWAVLLVALTTAGMAEGFVAVTLPLAGYATWRAYRAVIDPRVPPPDSRFGNESPARWVLEPRGVASSC